MIGPWRFAYLALSMAIMTLLGACADVKTDRQEAFDRANAYVAQHSDTDPKISAAIRELHLVKGMTPAEVTAAWGTPIRIEKSSKGISEQWYFDCNYPHTCISSGGRRRGRGELQRHKSRAFFVEGILTEWQM